MSSKTYEGMTARGQKILVTFSGHTSNNRVKAIACSDDYSLTFFRIPLIGWQSANVRLNIEWAPVIRVLYSRYLDDILTGETNG
jgi:hypothetical protein